MNQIVKTEPQGEMNVVPFDQGSAMIDMIGKLASDPNADIDKMERLMAMHERMIDRDAERQFNEAFSNAQRAMPAVPKRGKGYTSDYALWEDVNEKVISILSANGLSISYTSKFEPDAAIITATLRHISGHSISGEFFSPIESPINKNGKPSMNKAQQRGSAMSYGKRYVTINLLSLTTYGEDDDAFSTQEDEFDVSPWTARIAEAKSMDDLNKITAEISKEDVPSGALKMLRAAWAGQAKTVGVTNAA